MGVGVTGVMYACADVLGTLQTKSRRDCNKTPCNHWNSKIPLVRLQSLVPVP